MCTRMKRLLHERSKYDLSPERIGLKSNKTEVKTKQAEAEPKQAEENKSGVRLPTERDIYNIREKGRQTYGRKLNELKEEYNQLAEIRDKHRIKVTKINDEVAKMEGYINNVSRGFSEYLDLDKHHNLTSVQKQVCEEVRAYERENAKLKQENKNLTEEYNDLLLEEQQLSEELEELSKAGETYIQELENEAQEIYEKFKESEGNIEVEEHISTQELLRQVPELS